MKKSSENGEKEGQNSLHTPCNILKHSCLFVPQKHQVRTNHALCHRVFTTFEILKPLNEMSIMLKMPPGNTPFIYSTLNSFRKRSLPEEQCKNKETRTFTSWTKNTYVKSRNFIRCSLSLISSFLCVTRRTKNLRFVGALDSQQSL